MLIGNTIAKVSPIEDYMQIYFIDGSILNLYNNVTFSHQYQQYVNEIVKELIITNISICIKTSNKNIIMSLKEEDYSAPEAFAFCSKNEDWIVV